MTVLQSRVAAYARAHVILLHENWESTTVAGIVEAAAASLGLDGSSRFRFYGSPVQLGPQAALSLSLVLHELGTNANMCALEELLLASARLDAMRHDTNGASVKATPSRHCQASWTLHPAGPEIREGRQLCPR